MQYYMILWCVVCVCVFNCEVRTAFYFKLNPHQRDGIICDGCIQGSRGVFVSWCVCVCVCVCVHACTRMCVCLSCQLLIENSSSTHTTKLIVAKKYCSSENSALLIIRHPLPNIVSNFRQRSSYVYAINGNRMRARA